MNKACDKCPWTAKGKPDISKDQVNALIAGEWFCCHVKCGSCHGAKNLKDSLEGYTLNRAANRPADGAKVKVFTDKGNFYTGVHFHLLGGSIWESDSFTDKDEHVMMFKVLSEPYRECPNCGSPNTKEESLNPYVCRYCEGEPDNEY